MIGLPFRYADLSQLDEHEVLFCDLELTAKVGKFDIGHRFSSAVLDCSAGVLTFDEYSDKGAHSFDFQFVLSEAAESPTRDQGALFSSLSEEKLKAHSDAFKERTGYTPNQFVLLYRTKKIHRNDWGKCIYSHAMELVRSEQALQAASR